MSQYVLNQLSETTLDQYERDELNLLSDTTLGRAELNELVESDTEAAMDIAG